MCLIIIKIMIGRKYLKILSAVAGLVILFFSIYACEKTNPGPDYNPPADHTVSIDGFMHKTGYDQPLQNCIACHGDDLLGGTSGVSCFECHGTKW